MSTISGNGIHTVDRVLRNVSRMVALAEAGPLRRAGVDSMKISLKQSIKVLDSFVATPSTEAAVSRIHLGAKQLQAAADALEGASQVRRSFGPLRQSTFDVSKSVDQLRNSADELRAVRPSMNSGDDLVRSVDGGTEIVQMPAALPDDPFVSANPDASQRLVKRLVNFVTPRSTFTTHGAQNLPDGGFIMAATHGSNADGLYFSMGHDHTIRPMVNKAVLDIPVLGTAMKKLGAFPVSGKTSDRAIGIGRGMLDRGVNVTIMPEGRFVYGDHTGEAFTGVAQLALATGKPVVPAASAGTKPSWARLEAMWPSRSRAATTEFGKPIVFEKNLNPTKAELAEATELIWQRVDETYESVRAARLGAQR